MVKNETFVGRGLHLTDQGTDSMYVSISMNSYDYLIISCRKQLTHDDDMWRCEQVSSALWNELEW